MPDRRATRPDGARRSRTAVSRPVEPDPQRQAGDRRDGQPGTIEIGGGEDDHDWWIKVGDTGPGLPPKAREHLFTAFQGGTRKGGSGLGLAISAELVRGHGGRLELVRSDADGTEFVIRLPKTIGAPDGIVAVG